MSRMQWPTVILHDKRPLLPGQSLFPRIVLNIRNRPSNVVGMIQKDFPPARAPNTMFGVASARGTHRLGAVALEMTDHLLCSVPMLAHDQMNVVRHDCAGVHCVLSRCDNVRESVGDDFEVVGGKNEQWMLQQGSRSIVEGANLPSRRLSALAAQVQLAQFFEDVSTDQVRCASSRVIG